jgi:prepilin-type N-terminal cleavage/methylation domain-containing protein
MTSVVERLRAWTRRRVDLGSHESGMTMVEILMAVAILGIAVVGIVSSLSTASLASDYHRKQATGDTVMKSYAEVLQQSAQTFGYANCQTGQATPAHYNAAALLPYSWVPEQVDGVYTARVANVQYGHATGSAWSFNGTCTADEGLQKLFLEVTSADGRDTETLEIIVRRS